MNRRPRWVADTNVLVSAFLWRGTPGRVLALAAELEVQLFTSRDLLAELAATLAKDKLAKYVAATGLTAEQMLANYRRVVRLVVAKPLAQQVSRDLDDDVVLACAVAARAEVIVSGDEDLLTLKNFEGIAIVTPAQAARRLAA